MKIRFTEYDIASCPRHAGTSLVRRYAHLSPTHLRSVVERVSNYGKVSPSPKPEGITYPADLGQIKDGTVTGTGNTAGGPLANLHKLLKDYGAGDPD